MKTLLLIAVVFLMTSALSAQGPKSPDTSTTKGTTSATKAGADTGSKPSTASNTGAKTASKPPAETNAGAEAASKPPAETNAGAETASNPPTANNNFGCQCKSNGTSFFEGFL